MLVETSRATSISVRNQHAAQGPEVLPRLLMLRPVRTCDEAPLVSLCIFATISRLLPALSAGSIVSITTSVAGVRATLVILALGLLLVRTSLHQASRRRRNRHRCRHHRPPQQEWSPNLVLLPDDGSNRDRESSSMPVAVMPPFESSFQYLNGVDPGSNTRSRPFGAAFQPWAAPSHGVPLRPSPADLSLPPRPLPWRPCRQTAR